VVDDGSTDDSVQVLSQFGDAVTVLTQPNSGMAAAVNHAYRASRGDLVIFLDADDFLQPQCVERVLAAMQPRHAKAHWRMQLVDASGEPFGLNPPAQTALAEGDLADELCRTGAYVTVPTSGNCYARWALDQLMPVPEQDFKFSADGYLNLGAPMVGPVVAVDEALSSYRVHDRNRNTAQGRFEERLLRERLHNAAVLDAWLPRLAERTGRRASPGSVLAHPDFRMMQLLLDRATTTRSTAAQVRAGLGVARSAAGARTLRPRRRLLLAGIAPVLPLLPAAWVEHVTDVAFGGKPMRPLPSRS
jgi:hypothetical protein